MDRTFDIAFKKSLSNQKIKNHFPIFSYRSCIVLGFYTFGSLIHFELIFIYKMWYESKFISLPTEVQFIQYPLLEMTILSLLNCLCTFGRSQLTIYVE